MTDKEKAIEDLELIKTMVNRTKEAVDPAAPILILWGILVFAGNFATHFLIQNPDYHMYIGYTWWGIGISGFFASGIMGHRIDLKRYQTGINRYASRKLAMIWTILVPVGVVWSIMGPAYGIFPYESLSLFWALIYTIGIYIMGIFYSKEFIYGGITIFAGTILSVVFYQYHSLIIGVFMGSGTIIPGVIAHRRFKNIPGIINER